MPYDTPVSDEAGQGSVRLALPLSSPTVCWQRHALSYYAAHLPSPTAAAFEENGIHYAFAEHPYPNGRGSAPCRHNRKSRLSILLEKYGIASSDRQQAVDTFSLTVFWHYPVFLHRQPDTGAIFAKAIAHLSFTVNRAQPSPRWCRCSYAKGPLSTRRSSRLTVPCSCAPAGNI